MSAINDSTRVARSARYRTASFAFLLGAAVLFLASVMVQQRASIQGWQATSRDSTPRTSLPPRSVSMEWPTR